MVVTSLGKFYSRVSTKGPRYRHTPGLTPSGDNISISSTASSTWDSICACGMADASRQTSRKWLFKQGLGSGSFESRCVTRRTMITTCWHHGWCFMRHVRSLAYVPTYGVLLEQVRFTHLLVVAHTSWPCVNFKESGGLQRLQSSHGLGACSPKARAGSVFRNLHRNLAMDENDMRREGC